MDEGRWDLGSEGVVRLVHEGDVETVYLDARIAARTTAALDEHRVPLPRRSHAAVATASAAYRHAEPPARELRLCRTPRGWTGVLDGRNLAPTTVSLEPPAPDGPRAPRRGRSGVFVRRTLRLSPRGHRA